MSLLLVAVLSAWGGWPTPPQGCFLQAPVFLFSRAFLLPPLQKSAQYNQGCVWVKADNPLVPTFQDLAVLQIAVCAVGGDSAPWPCWTGQDSSDGMSQESTGANLSSDDLCRPQGWVVSVTT